MPGILGRLAIFLTAGAILAVPAMAQPSGQGDPKAVTCMRGEKRTGSAFTPPPVCKTNAEWAALQQQRNDPTNIGNPGFCVGPEGAANKGGTAECR